MPRKSKTDKTSEGIEECWEAWGWLRKLPEYKADFARFKREPGFAQWKKHFKNPPDKLGLKQKWYFFPLTDPKNDAPGRLIEALTLMGEHPHLGSVRLRAGWLYGIIYGLKANVSPGMLPELPKSLTLSVNPRKPISQLQHDFIRLMRDIQKAYEIKPKRIRYSGFMNRYKVLVGQNLNWTESRMKAELKVSDYEKLTPEQRKSKRMATYRAMKKRHS
jgi:hypothetical protein